MRKTVQKCLGRLSSALLVLLLQTCTHSDPVGYVNTSGKLVIEPRFDSMGPFSDGLAVVVLKGKQGYCDSSGAIVIAPQFEIAHDFSEGLAAATKQKGYFVAPKGYGFIDKTGDWVIAPRFDSADDFSEGLAAVREKALCGYIDRTGAWVIAPIFAEAFAFSEGLALVRAQFEGEPEARFSYIDPKGKIVLNESMGGQGHFSEGLATTMRPNDAMEFGSGMGYMDQSGALVIAADYDQASAFSEGLAAVSLDGLWGYLNHAGTFVIPPQFQEAESFQDGMALVRIDSKQWTFITKDGVRVAPPRVRPEPTSGFYGFSEGLAPWPEQGRWGYIDRQGRWAIKPEYRDAGHFSEGLAPVVLQP